jgi:O-acetylserine/cysteine efflux transporter
MPLRDIGLALVVVTIWGINFVAISWGVDEVPPLLLTALRYLTAALPAIFFLKPPAVPLRVLVGYGIAIGALQFGLLYAAIGLGMPAGLSSLVMQVQAFFTFGLSVLFLGQRPTPVQLVGAAVAFGGIAVIATERLVGATLVPLLMTLAAAFFWAVGNIITKKAGKVDMLSFIAWTSLVPPLPLLAASLLFEGPGAVAAIGAMSPVGIGSLLFMSYGATLVGYGLWSVLLSRHPANVVAPFSLLVPIVGIASAALVLGERVSGLEIAGSTLVFAGLLLNVFGPRLARRTP